MSRRKKAEAASREHPDVQTRQLWYGVLDGGRTLPLTRSTSALDAERARFLGNDKRATRVPRNHRNWWGDEIHWKSEGNAIH